MEGVLRGLRLDERDWQTEMLESWVELAGRPVAKHARPGRVSGSCLTVFVDSPVWLSELSRTSRVPLLQALQRRFGANRIKDLRFAPDPDGPPRTISGA
jgi:predicted nucleic acid-binding Zn ribbon protein